MNIKIKLLVIASLLLPFNLRAHDTISNAGLASGMLHPLTGMDHLLAMLGVGIVSAIMGGKNIWVIPIAFVSAMALGGFLGIEGVAFPYTEIAISISIIALGSGIIFLKKRFSTPIIFIFVFLFGLFHGNAHGVEMPRMATPAFFTIGFLLSTIFIHVVGIFFGEVISGGRYGNYLLKISGVMITSVGIYFLKQAILF